MAEGRIKWYSEKKRYGFITTEENKDIFLHQTGIKEYGYFGFQKNDLVTFDVKETAKGRNAVNVRPLKAS